MRIKLRCFQEHIQAQFSHSPRVRLRQARQEAGHSLGDDRYDKLEDYVRRCETTRDYLRETLFKHKTPKYEDSKQRRSMHVRH